MTFFVVCIVYWPGLSGDFFLDDYPHITHNSAIQIQDLTWQAVWSAANSTQSGPLGRPLSLASFALNYYFFALDPFYFKLLNLLLHLLTGLGVFFLVERMAAPFVTRDTLADIALLTAAMWLLHPLNVSTVLYAVQRMTLLSGLFTIWGLVAYCRGRNHLINHRPAGWSWIALGLASGFIGLFAKETAILILGYILLIEWLVFRFRCKDEHRQNIFRITAAVITTLSCTWILGHTLLEPGWIESAYAHRSFSLMDRLFTESRVLLDYLRQIWVPDIRSMGLYHDGYPISRGLLQPPATLIAIIIELLLIIAAVVIRKHWPLFLFVLLWFLVGHSAESTFLPLEIKYEHRNYIPMLGMIMLMTIGIHAATQRFHNARKLQLTIFSLLLLTFSGTTLIRTTQFGDFWGFSQMEAAHYPESSRANQGAAMSLIRLMMQTREPNPQLVINSTEYLRRSAAANPNTVAPLFTAILFLPEITHQPPAGDFIETLHTRLEHALLDANINAYFLALLRQAEDGKLQLSHTQVQALFDATEANANLRSNIKADIMAVRAAYAQSVEHDNRRAKVYIDHAIEMQPDLPSIYVPAVWIYQEAGLWQHAEDLLQTLQRLDTYGINGNSITWLSQRQKKKSN